jgi:glutamate formiminotransferase/formiminotetrahydrofolate cyclodeaminase
MGAFLNVKINAGGLADKAFSQNIIDKGNVLESKAIALETEILKIVNSKI